MNQEIELNKMFEIWTNGINGWTNDLVPKKTIVKTPTSITFSSKDFSRQENKKPHFYPEFNNIKLHTWSGSLVGLKIGTRLADLAMKTSSGGTIPLNDVKGLQKIIDDGFITHLLIQVTNLSDLDENIQNFKEKRQLVPPDKCSASKLDKKAVFECVTL